MGLHMPTIHLNGTGKKGLNEQLEKVHTALQAALDAMREAVPNGRDYYPQGPTALKEAEAEHHERIKKVLEVQDEYRLIYESIND